MSNHITSGPNFLHEDEGFRICQYGLAGGMKGFYRYTFIEHKCTQENYSHSDKGWRWHVSDPEKSGIECRMCDTRAPDGLQAVFWFVSGTHP